MSLKVPKLPCLPHLPGSITIITIVIAQQPRPLPLLPMSDNLRRQTPALAFTRPVPPRQQTIPVVRFGQHAEEILAFTDGEFD